MKGIGPQGLGRSGNNGYSIGSPAKIKAHKMHKDGDVKNVTTAKEHNSLKDDGYGHSPAKKAGAWTRKEGQSETGGLNQKGVNAYKAANPGSKLKTAVTGKVKPGSKAAGRRASFCARMGGVKGPMKKPNGEPTRKALALRKWKC